MLQRSCLGWYYHLEQPLPVPFSGKCITQRGTWPRRKGQESQIVPLAFRLGDTHDASMPSVTADGLISGSFACPSDTRCNCT